jgi:Protein of unknown function (DUF3035)
MMPRSFPAPAARLVLLSALVTLAGCSGSDLTRSFGLTRDPPDEFQVTTRAPLSMPPDFSIRPPRPGASRPQEQSQAQQAEAALVPQVELGAGNAAMSPGQQALLQQAGPPAPADIRSRVDTESARLEPGHRFADRLMFWRSPPPPGTVVDPTRESQRLRENAALGQSPSVGDTPIIQRKAGSVLGSIF